MTPIPFRARGPLAVLLLAVAGCTRAPAPPARGTATAGASRAEAGGEVVVVGPDQAGLFTTTAAREQSIATDLRVPARTVAAVAGLGADRRPLMLFQSEEASGLWADFVRADAEYARAGTQRRRLAELYAHDAASGRDLLDAETAERQADASVREAEAKLRENGLDPARLRAMRPGTALVVADVPESRAAQLRVGDQVVLDFTALPGESQTARVGTIAEAVDPQTRAVQVALELPSLGGRIKPGMFARARISDRATAVLAVPLSAVVTAESGTFVFVQTAPARFARRAVTLGANDGQMVEVRAGVAAGEPVVSANAPLLKGLSFGY